jgi:NADH:ubiquinone oxidoreductase subunit 3 (subunit A)
MKRIGLALIILIALAAVLLDVEAIFLYPERVSLHVISWREVAGTASVVVGVVLLLILLEKKKA